MQQTFEDWFEPRAAATLERYKQRDIEKPVVDDPRYWERQARNSADQVRKDALVARKFDALRVLESRGVRVDISGCGCCESPRVKIQVRSNDGAWLEILDDFEVNIGNIDGRVSLGLRQFEEDTTP